jgi:hypothetical protein
MVAPLALGLGRGISRTFGSGRRLATKDAAQAVLGGMSLNLSSNLTTVQKALDAFGRNQLPFATAMALNDAAFEVRKDTIERVWPKSVKLRNPAFMKAVMMPIRGENRATKRNLTATVQNFPSGARNRDYLQRLAVGGVKTANGRSIAIPAEDMRLRSRGGVTAGNRPRALLDKPRVFRQMVGGQEMILQRRGKARYPLKRLYLLEQQPMRIDDQFDFYGEGMRTAKRSMATNFNKRFRQAKRSAK